MPQVHKMFLYAGSFIVKMGFWAKMWTFGFVVCYHFILESLICVISNRISSLFIYSRTFYILRLKPQLLSGGQTMQENACSRENQLESVSALKSFMLYTSTNNYPPICVTFIKYTMQALSNYWNQLRGLLIIIGHQWTAASFDLLKLRTDGTGSKRMIFTKMFSLDEATNGNHCCL